MTDKEVIKVNKLSKEYRLGNINTLSMLSDLGFRNKTKAYDNSKLLRALDDVSCTFFEGETIGIIGKNGAGKSTFLKILSRITSPTSGTVSIKGRVASLLEVGTGFHPDLTGKENIFLNGAILGMNTREIKSKMDEIIEFSGVEKFVDTPVKRFSSGMYVRLAFSVAAHLNADVMLMDEVLAVGDTEFQKKCLGKMDEVSRQGRTILFVSHNLEAIRSLCSRTLLLENGRMSCLGNTAEVIEKYLMREATDRTVIHFPEINKKVCLRKIELYGKDMQLSNYISWNNSLVIKFELDVKQIIDRSVISFGLVNRFGNRVFTNDYPFKDLFSTIGKSSLTITVPPSLLSPGRYKIAFGIHIPNQDHIYLLDENIFVHIFNPASDNYLYHTDNGSIIVPCKWEVIEE
jgi:lipopolysaccharide transport system ATP-binding protein